MSQQPPSLADWQRIAMGDAPWKFLLETAMRALVVYLLLLLFMRLMGKRVASQMSCSELAVILMLGAAIGLPIQVPDKGLLPAVVVLAVVLLFQRGLAHLTFRSRKIELTTYGDVMILLKDGRLLPEGLKKALLSPHKIFATLRSLGVEHLGELRRVYLEASGDFSMIRYRNPKPGLLILPFYDPGSGRFTVVDNCVACSNCGNVVEEHSHSDQCAFCGTERGWGTVVTRRM